MILCDECNEAIVDGDEAYVFSDNDGTYYFCCATCAADFLCEVEEVYDEDEDYEDEDEEIDLSIFG